MAQERSRHPVERGPVAHRVVPAPAMHVDVDETWAEVRTVSSGLVLIHAVSAGTAVARTGREP